MYKNILVAIDTSHGPEQDMFLEAAKALSDESGARITALSIHEPVPSIVYAECPDDILVAVGKRVAEELGEIVSGWGDVATVVREGKPGPTIVEYASKHDVDCIIVMSHIPELSDYFLGSTAARVVRHAPCTVHVMR